MPDSMAGLARPDPIDEQLQAAGARWRDAQPEPASVDPAIFAPDGRERRPWLARSLVSFAAGVAATLVVVVLAVAVSSGLFPQTDVGGPGASGASSPHDGSDLAHCPVTKPTTPFQPPTDGVIPASKAWYGNRILWTWLDRDGEVWTGLPRSETGLTQKTFWWSQLFDVRREPQPEIYVVGSRIGPDGSFGFGPGTNAGGDFGSAMLVGIDVPAEGCWNITAHYRGASLSYVVWVGPPG